MKVTRKIIEIDEALCDGCGQCVPSCAEGALQIIDGKARVIADKFCDGLGACLGECPTGALKIIEREAEEFDEAAVEALLKKAEAEGRKETAFGGGCPSAGIQTFIPKEDCETANIPTAHHQGTGLTHWPIQIRLVPPGAPFLKGADLLVVADCSPLAYPNFHSDFMRGKVVMMGCPKFDDAAGYIEKFTEIFKTAGIRRITSVFMEVPCCSGLPMIVKRALAESGADIPMEEVVISTRGRILEPASVA